VFIQRTRIVVPGLITPLFSSNFVAFDPRPCKHFFRAVYEVIAIPPDPLDGYVCRRTICSRFLTRVRNWSKVPSTHLIIFLSEAHLRTLYGHCFQHSPKSPFRPSRFGPPQHKCSHSRWMLPLMTVASHQRHLCSVFYTEKTVIPDMSFGKCFFPPLLSVG